MLITTWLFRPCIILPVSTLLKCHYTRLAIILSLLCTPSGCAACISQTFYSILRPPFCLFFSFHPQSKHESLGLPIALFPLPLDTTIVCNKGYDRLRPSMPKKKISEIRRKKISNIVKIVLCSHGIPNHLSTNVRTVSELVDLSLGTRQVDA